MMMNVTTRIISCTYVKVNKHHHIANKFHKFKHKGNFTMSNETNIVGNRIKEIRGKMSQDEFVEKVGISRGALSYYENGKRNPDCNVIKSICLNFNVSADYILGLTDTKTADTNIKAVCEYTGLSERTVKMINYQKKFSEIYNILLTNPIYGMILDDIKMLRDTIQNDEVKHIMSSLKDEIIQKNNDNYNEFYPYMIRSINSSSFIRNKALDTFSYLMKDIENIFRGKPSIEDEIRKDINKEVSNNGKHNEKDK